MTEEERFVIGQFQKNYLNSGKRIVIYGIGRHTKLILEAFPQNPVVGLMDAVCTETFMYGKRLIDSSQVEGSTDIIVVVARKAVHGIIYPRIRKFKDCGIQILDIQGKEVGVEVKADTSLLEWNIGFEDVKSAIEGHACVSFDLFDTLLMRRYLLADDVPRAAALRTSFPRIEIFVKARRQAEANGAALQKIGRIYEEAAAVADITEEQMHRLKDAEFERELKETAARKRVVQLLEYARRRGKKIFILTDMYYERKQLRKLCIHCGIAVEEDEIFVSCAMGASKECGDAFELLKSKAGTEDIVHIGDHAVSDIQNAKRHGIDTIHLLSSYEMLSHSTLAGMLCDLGSYEKRCFLGLMAASLWNDPFALNKTRGKVQIHRFWDFGYFMGPVFYSFACWLVCQASQHGIQQMLLPGRDGFLIKRILDILQPEFTYIYIHASRRAYKFAALKNEADIRQVLDEDYKGSLEELYAVRFFTDISLQETQGALQGILDHARYQRTCLLNYLESCGVRRVQGTGVFDCVAGGTVQSCLERLLGIQMQGFYFGTFDTGKKGLQIHSAFGKAEQYKSGSKVLEHYLLLEALLAEISGTLVGFVNGDMVYEDNKPPVQLAAVQDGILTFVQDARELLGDCGGIDLAYGNEIVGAIFDGKVEVAEEIRRIFYYDDSYLGEKGRCRIWK